MLYHSSKFQSDRTINRICLFAGLILILHCITFAEDLRGEIIVPPSKKLEDLTHLSELCVDLLQQNEEHYGEVSFYISVLQLQAA